jgi:putative restriction endonuclease
MNRRRLSRASPRLQARSAFWGPKGDPSPGGNHPDPLMRMAAFDQVRRLSEVYDHLTAAELKPGFSFEGERIPLVNPQRGIFKPQQMRFLLSIKTVFPKPGGKVWYDDQREVHRQIFEGDQMVDYAFMGQNPDAADNRWLREAFENQVPIIYFLGIAPGRYQAMLPAFISGWDAKALKASVAFGVPDQESITPPENALERRYALRAVKQRLHQASFREAVINAYNGRCALSGLPEPLLLDAAHIVADKDERLGQPVVPNGIPLSKIHHAAFDAHLIGIDPDYRLHVSERLLIQHDGPMLEALKLLNGETIHLPNRDKDRPDRDRLALRFERFKTAA